MSINRTSLKDGSYIEFQSAVLKQLPRPDEVSKETAEFWQSNQEELKIVLKDGLLPKPSSDFQNNSILRLLTVNHHPVIKATTGLRFLAEAKNTFKSFIDPDLMNWKLYRTSYATPETLVNVYEMLANATLAQIFGSLSNDLDKLCLTQDQIEEFCLAHSGQLRGDGYVTFFLFKENEHFFIARVSMNFGGKRVDVSGLGSDFVWDGGLRYRVVVPKL